MHPESTSSNSEQLDALIAQIEQAADQGENIDREAILQANPQFAEALTEYFDNCDRLREVTQDQRADTKKTDKSSQAVEGNILDGRYKLLENIGEGGMGSVWVAEQLQPVKRRVAIKFVKAGMDSKVVLARFEAERQALAILDHPNKVTNVDLGAESYSWPRRNTRCHATFAEQEATLSRRSTGCEPRF